MTCQLLPCVLFAKALLKVLNMLQEEDDAHNENDHSYQNQPDFDIRGHLVSGFEEALLFYKLCLLAL